VTAELLPAVVATVGGGVLLAVLLITESQETTRMRAERIPFAVTFPLGVQPAAAMQALEALAHLPVAIEPVIEVAAARETIRHRLYLPSSSAEAVRAQLQAAIPGLRLTPQPPQAEPDWTRVLRVTVPKQAVLRTADDPAAAGRSFLAALLPLTGNEEVAVRLATRSGRPSKETELSALPREDERQHERAWRQKLMQPGVFASGLVLVRAADSRRARVLAQRVVAVLDSRRFGRDSLTVRRRLWGRSWFPRASRRSGWATTAELLPCLGWPLGESVVLPGVQLGAARQIGPREELARRGRPLFMAERHGQPRPVALSQQAALRHVAVLGASGGGKSTMLAAGIVADIEAGHAGVLIDPKNDLVATVLDHVEPKHADRIAVIDPSADRVPGVDLFAGGDPDLRADVLLAIFRSLFADAWGPRIDSYLRLGLRSLAEVPGAGLLDLPRLYLDPVFRRQVVARLRDPLLIGQWQGFEALSEAEKTQHLQAPLSRVLALIGRPAVQAVFGPNPKLSIGELLRRRGWLLVALSGGAIGAPAARIIGSALTYLVWSQISARAALPPEQRKPVYLNFDETQALTDQGSLSLEDFLEQARGLGCGVSISTQAIARMPATLRTALLANVGTLVCFRAGADEATRLSRELPGLTATDLQSLAPFEVAARVAVPGGSGSVVVTGKTEPLGEPTGQADRIRNLSAQRWGRSRHEVEQAIANRYGGKDLEPDDNDEIGRQQRRQP
jgi:hypothetical protein